jgi:acetylornithine deacetylase
MVGASDNLSLEIQPERLKGLLKDLVDIYSPSGKEEEILEYAEAHLKKQGLAVVRQEVDENRCNLVTFPEAGDEVDLCFFGLGTADTKAGCAAMMEAFTILSQRGGNFPPVGLALVVGEEEDNSGARRLVEEYDFGWAVIAEPTNLAPCFGHYGYLEVLLRTRGKRAHSAMPELGQNAIETMLKLLLQITEYAASGSHKLVYNIRELSGYPGGFFVPDSCEAWLDLHLPPDFRIDVLKGELEQLVTSAVKSVPSLDADLRFEETYAGYRISQERPLAKKLAEVFRKLSLPWEPENFRSHSDGNILWVAGVDPIILGPGRLEVAHTPEESVSFRQVLEATRIYLNFALSL